LRRGYRLRAKAVEKPASLALDRRPALLTGEEDVPETRPCRLQVTVAVALEVGAELSVIRWPLAGRSFEEEAHLLHQDPPHDRVAAFELERHGSAVEILVGSCGRILSQRLLAVTAEEEPHLLREPPTDRLLAAVEAVAQSLAIEDLLFDGAFDERLLIGRRLALTPDVRGELREARCRDDHRRAWGR
jgi:hypothetical protein